MSLATITDVQTSLLRDLTTQEGNYVSALLDRSESLILARIPDALTRANTDITFASNVVSIESDAVARVFRNPDGFISEGDGSYNYNRNLQVASGLLDILAADWQKLGIGYIYSSDGASDGYAKARYKSLNPSTWFQYGWPGNRFPG